jgi:hypothetical protein
VTATFYRITLRGLEPLREGGYLVVNRGFKRCLENAAERRELEAAGWEPVVGRVGKIVWGSPGAATSTCGAWRSPWSGKMRKQTSP